MVWQTSKSLPEKHTKLDLVTLATVGRWVSGVTHSWQVVLHYYAEWIVSQPSLLAELGSLSGCTLVCDCPHNRLCHGDVLAASCWDHAGRRPLESNATSYRPARWVQAIACGTRLVSAVPLPLTQEDVVEAFKALCWFADWTHCRFPMIEDLLNTTGAWSFPSWRRSSNWHGLPLGPRVVSAVERPSFRMALGDQTGAAASGKAAPPLIPFGLGPDGHFQFSSLIQDLGTPFAGSSL